MAGHRATPPDHRLESVETARDRRHAADLPRATKKRSSHARSATLRPTHEASEANPLSSLADAGITRRQLFVGAAGIAVAAAVGGGAYALASGSGSTAEAAEASLSVPEEDVFTTEQCEYVEDATGLITLRTRASLPYGTILTACGDSVAACLVPTETADPLLQVGLLHLGSGNMTDALKSAVGSKEGFQILDARAHGGGLIWLESNLLTGQWRVYTTTLDGASVGEPAMAEERDETWQLPSLAVSDGFGWWQTAPKDSSDKTLSSALLRIPFGYPQDSAETVLESAGGFACDPAPAGTGIACAMKESRTGNTWQLIYVGDDSGEITDSLTMPSSMKPLDVSYGPNGFGFTFDSIYQVGGGISNLGTYTPADAISMTVAQAESDILDSMRAEAAAKAKDDAEVQLTEADVAKAKAQAEDAVCELYSAAEWFRFPRSPVTPPAFTGNWVFVKSTNVVAAVNLTARKYVTITTESATQGYGEYLASSGTSSRMVTFANVDYTPMNGEQIRECTVRVWEGA